MYSCILLHVTKNVKYLEAFSNKNPLPFFKNLDGIMFYFAIVITFYEA